jgi:hypothetical protein
MRTARYILEIYKVNDLYEGRIHQGDPEESYSLTNLDLSSDSELVIKGQLYKLGDLMDSLINYDVENITSVFDERGQLELGQYLFSQTFGKLSRPERERLRGADSVDLRLVTEDENIGRLPWTLLADAGVFLSATGWSIALSTHLKYKDHALPPSPVVLLVLPQPLDLSPTDADRHRQALEEALSGHIIRVASTWEQFTRLSTESAPQVIYYYGHGTGDWNSSRLSFAAESDHRCVEKPIADVANHLRNLQGGPPRLIYLNCCYGDAGGILGAGRQLGGFVPAVITNSTAARISAAQEQGLSFLRSVLLKGTPPHTAIAEIRGNLSGLNLTFKDIRWMTPVLHCHYDRWTTHLRRPRSRLARIPDWQLKVNRSKQFSVVHSNTMQMMRCHFPPALAYVWYGEEEQGVSNFNRRLEIELRELPSPLRVRSINLDWPMHYEDPATDFEYMFTSALGERNIKSVDDIPHCIADEFYGKGNEPTLLYISNKQPLRPSAFPPADLRKFLKWWEHSFVSALSGTQMFAVLGLSFILKNVEQDRSVFERSKISHWFFNKISFQALEELGDLVLKDLVEFLRMNRIDLPPDRLNIVLKNILSRSRGRYEPTMEMLGDVEQIVWTYDREEEDEEEDDI